MNTADAALAWTFECHWCEQLYAAEYDPPLERWIHETYCHAAPVEEQDQ